MKGHVLAAMLAGILTNSPALAQNDGQTAFNNFCRTCHTMKEGDHRQGPSVAGIVDRKAGSQAGYNYSSSMKQAGITWDAATLDHFIADPEAVVRGNTMKPYSGIADAALRKAIVEFMESSGSI